MLVKGPLTQTALEGVCPPFLQANSYFTESASPSEVRFTHDNPYSTGQSKSVVYGRCERVK
jgi:hypothetical protein